MSRRSNGRIKKMKLSRFVVVTHVLLLTVTAPVMVCRSSKSLTSKDVDRMMTTLSNWGRWGAEDQLGTINLITAEKRKQAAALVKEGVSVSMAHDAIKVEQDGSPPFEHVMLPESFKPDSVGANDRFAVSYHGFTTTHMDALCHFFYEGKMYNGFSRDEITRSGAGKLSVHALKDGIFTRAVLMDMPRLWGLDYLPGDKAIYPEDLEAWEKKAGVRVGPGDALLLRTGRWARRRAEGGWDIMRNSAGLHASCLPWLKERDVAIVGSDLATDVMPSQVKDSFLPVHMVLIVGMGTPILDVLDLEAVGEAAQARRRWEFLMTAAPLRVPGATGSPLNPIATF